MSRGNIKTLCLHCHKTYNSQTHHSCVLGWADPFYQVTFLFDYVVTWCYEIKKRFYLQLCKTCKSQTWHNDLDWEAPFYMISPALKDLKASNLPQWQLRLRGFHLLNHMFLWLCIHMISNDKKSRYISTSIKPISIKLGRMVPKSNGLSPRQSYEPFLTCSHQVIWQIKSLVSPLPQNLWPRNFQGSRLGWRISSYQVIIPLDYKIMYQMTNSGEDSNFYATILYDEQTRLCGDLQWNLIWPISTK